MSDERSARLARIVAEARERTPAARGAFLDEACGGDGALRRDAEEALRATEKEIAPLDLETIAEGAPPVAGTDLAPQTRLGPYRVVSLLGRGGQGAVYLAERADEQYERRVAIKVLPFGLGSPDAERLFAHERRVLAGLDHPSIARLLDAGAAADGRSYFVMELVEGEPIDVFCADRRLGTRDRVRLLQAVCEAVQHAHRNLVVHRDLKPRNILVGPDGVPKLLDFGIAKLLEPGAAHAATVTVGAAMTPDYASPEQVRMEPVTTATDVYSLGVILYELLTDRRPYHVRSLALHDLVRAICEEEPPRPSDAVSPDRRRARELRGDLDTIALTALQKDPARRYPSVEALGEDLRLHLEGLPVRARPDSFLYRAGKHARRHRLGVAAALVLLATLLGGVLATSWQARRAEAARRLAERRFADVRSLAHTLLFDVHDAIETLGGSTPARELLVTRGLAYLDALAGESGGDPALQVELAVAYRKLGDIQGRPGFANLGDRPGALASYRKAVALLLATPSPARDPALGRELATTHDRVGDTLRTLGDSAGALASYREALALREGMAAVPAAGAEEARDLATSRQRVADVLAATGALDEALAEQRRALAAFEAVAAAGGLPARRDLFIARVKLGDRLLQAGDAAGALPSYRGGLDLAESLAERDPADGRAQRELAVALDKVANALAASGGRAEALVHYRRALALRESLFARDPRNAELGRDIAVSHDKVGRVLLDDGRTADALESFRRALALDEAARRSRPGDTQVRLDVSLDRQSLGDALRAAGRPGEARREYEVALSEREALAAADPSNVDRRAEVAALRAAVAAALAEEARTPEACGEARRWLARAREAAASLPRPGIVAEDLAGADRALATCPGGR